MIIETTSISRVSMWSRCQMSHNLRYIQRAGRPKTKNATLLGTICHTAIEHWYLAEEEFPTPASFLDTGWEEALKRDKLSGKWPELKELLAQPAEVIKELKYRASPFCSGPKAIRKSDGSVSDAPHMTKGWKIAAEQLGLNALMEELNPKVQKLLGERFSDVDDIYGVYVDAQEITEAYNPPEDVQKVLALEFEIGSPTMWPSEIKAHGVASVYRPIELYRYKYRNGMEAVVFFQGGIDMVTLLHNGKLRLTDTKSSAKDLGLAEVQNHKQLHIYAYAMRILVPDYEVGELSIHNLRTGTVLVTPVDWELAEHYWQDMIEQDRASRTATILNKHEVFEYQSPCAKYDKKNNVLTEPCFGFEKCHPILYKKLGLAPVTLNQD